MSCGRGFCPAVNGEYLRKRFGEAVWESPLATHLKTLAEDEADSTVSALVDRLLTEVGAE